MPRKKAMMAKPSKRKKKKTMMKPKTRKIGYKKGSSRTNKTMKGGKRY